MTPRPPAVLPLGPEDWERYRDVRLEALTEAPTAFGSTFERERSLTEESWRARLARPGQFLAEWSGAPCGLVGVKATEGHATIAEGDAEAGAAELVSLWVRPDSRGLGVGDALVREVLGWAAGNAVRRVELWVVEGNRPAERLYARHGFRRTGRVQPVGGGRPGMEFAMSCPVAPAGGA